MIDCMLEVEDGNTVFLVGQAGGVKDEAGELGVLSGLPEACEEPR